MKNLEEYWKQKENQKPAPEILNEISEIAYEECKNDIYNVQKSKQFIDKLYDGDFLLIKKAIPIDFIDNLKTKLLKIGENTPSSFHKMIEGCPNFHKKIDDKIDTKYSIKSTRHSFYFFRWNEESEQIFINFDTIWSDIKYLSGLNRDSFKNNTPKNGIVDRVQIVKYPVNTGYIEPHQHNVLHQRLIISVYMSEQGVDYKNGGTYFLDKNKNKINSERNIDAGDVGIFYASMIHGVDPVSIFTNQSISNSGRWWCGLYSPETDHLENRKTSNPAAI